MKSLLLLLFLPLQLWAQDLTGVWVGIIHNDSTDMDLHYEVVLTEQKGKLSGFSYTNFIVDGRSLTGVKSLTVTKRFGKLYIEDEKLVFNNYPFEPPKGVKQLSILELSQDEEILSGRFTTARTKQYGRPVTGHVHVLRKRDLAASKLMEILGGLQLTAGLSFLKTDVAASNATPPKPTGQVATPKTETAKTETAKTETAKSETVKTETSNNTRVVATEVKAEPVKPVVTTAPATSNTNNNSTAKINTGGDKSAENAIANNTKTNNTTTVTTPAPNTTVKTTTSPEKAVAIVVPEVKKPAAELALANRRIETVQTILFSSDSLLLELYDNGYVDGDSVSVMLNGRALFSNVRLSEKAEKKTIYITPDMGDTINLVLLAENLGSIAPNSGLAIIRDGQAQHKIAFSGDMQKNAGIILRRKKPSAQ